MSTSEPAVPADDSAATPAHPHRHRPVRSFVLRAGRLGTGQARALAELGPRFMPPYQPAVPDWDAVFGRSAPRVLEIGFGMGQATAAIAAARPDLDFIGVEVHQPGVGALLREIGERGLGNIRILQHDAVEVLRQMVAPASLAGLHVYFPDPWHKKRHHKRRLIQPALVDPAGQPAGARRLAALRHRLGRLCPADAAGAGRLPVPGQHRRRLRAAPGDAPADQVRGPRPEAGATGCGTCCSPAAPDGVGRQAAQVTQPV